MSANDAHSAQLYLLDDATGAWDEGSGATAAVQYVDSEQAVCLVELCLGFPSPLGTSRSPLLLLPLQCSSTMFQLLLHGGNLLLTPVPCHLLRLIFIPHVLLLLLHAFYVHLHCPDIGFSCRDSCSG